MADKFLNTGGGGNINLSNGSVNIFAAILGADNLQPSKALKTNSVKELISTNLDIADVNNLQNVLDSVLTNPFQGTLRADDFAGDSIKDKTETSSINLTPTEINFVASTVLLNGQPIKADLQRVYDDSQTGEIILSPGKPFVLSTDLLVADADTNEVKVVGNLLLNGVNIEDEIDTKYDKTGGVLTGNFIHFGDNVQFSGVGSFQLQNQGIFQIQNQGSVQIQPIGPLTLKGFGVLGEINMGNHKISNVATPTDPFDAATKAYIDNEIINLPPLTDLENKTQNIGSVITNDITNFTGRIQLNDNAVTGNSIYISPVEHNLVIARNDNPGNNFELTHENNRGIIRMGDGIELSTDFAYVTDGSGIISFNPVQNQFTLTKNATANFVVTVEDGRTVLGSNQKIESEQNFAVVNAGNSTIYTQIFPTSILIDSPSNQLVLLPGSVRSSFTNLVLDAPKVECLNDVIAPNQIGVPLCFAGSAGNGEYLVFNGLADENLNQSVPGIKHTAVSPIGGVCRQIAFVKRLVSVTSTFEISIGITSHTFSISGRAGIVTIPDTAVVASEEITIRKTADADARDLNMIVYIAPTSN